MSVFCKTWTIYFQILFNFFHTVEVTKTNVFQNLFYVPNNKIDFIQECNCMRETKWWQNIHFGGSFPFNKDLYLMSLLFCGVFGSLQVSTTFIVVCKQKKKAYLCFMWIPYIALVDINTFNKMRCPDECYYHLYKTFLKRKSRIKVNKNALGAFQKVG